MSKLQGQFYSELLGVYSGLFVQSCEFAGLRCSSLFVSSLLYIIQTAFDDKVNGYTCKCNEGRDT